ncbi:ABC transporter substrate-binding protein [Pontibacter silvestris]|uniref:ABC transporter substrate-binding protein n=1 Tax=Pontibacter silvestris TaxID=2305183 RepID=A0ABW4WTD8_9BACT|nr:ABC transporter substrate-binding protein [Pontibacter silvestris]MCC9137974.1 ABC transporter substrate-binding protein [Pontibacter silvestris]
MRKINLLVYSLALFLCFCSKPQRQLDEVRVRLTKEPETLNPVSYSDAEGLQVINLLFQSLLVVDLASDELKPALVVDLPVVERVDSFTYFNYEIREEATWANGSPVTAADVAFTLKVLKAPLVNNEKLKPQVEFISDIVVDQNNNRKFKLKCEGFMPEMELLTGDFFILPAYLFDQERLLEPITVASLEENTTTLENNQRIKAFAEHFNSSDFSRNKELLQGSGGYILDSWVSGQYLTLTKKQDWWGNKTNTDYLSANPQRISFQIIPDNTTALMALRNRQLDVLENIPAAEFQQLKQDETFLQDYALYTPSSYEFVYVGLNSRLPKLADKHTRQAIAHLLDVDNMIKVSQQSYATPTVGPVPPTIKEFYNTSIQPYSYNVQQAKELLQTAGWENRTDGWYKKINGQQEKLTLTVSYKAGNTVFENAALIFQQSAAEAGIPVILQAQEGSLFTLKSKSHNFEMFFRSLSGNPFVFNFKPLFHTSFASQGGFNYTGFGNAESDAILDEVITTQDQAQKAQLLRRLQEILLDEATFLSLYYQQERLAISKRFGNIKTSGINPNYDVSAFTLKE